MKHFTPDFNKFLKELAANNNRDWFNSNKKRYEESVKKPFESFVGELIKHVDKHEPIKEKDPKKSIFRIYRDVRFSKDKSPYKTQMGAIISPMGRKDMETPAGFYLEMGPQHIRVYGGVYKPSTKNLEKIRKHIAKDPKALEKLQKSAGFKKNFGEIKGEQNKRLPKPLMEKAADTPILLNKQFYYFAEIKPSQATATDLVKQVMEKYKASKPMSEYFRKAMGKKK